MLLAVLLVLPCVVASAQGVPARVDTVASADPPRSTWVVPPPTGQAQKTQGLIFMAGGVLTALAGYANMSQSDPCADVRESPFVECVSNIEDVHTAGQVMAGVGAGFFAIGLLRYGMGVRKARAYRAWRVRNGVVVAEASAVPGAASLSLSLRY